MSAWRDKATLERLYLTEGRSSLQIAAQLGCDRSVVTDWLRKHGIPRRTTAQTQKGKVPATKGKGKRHTTETVPCACGCGQQIKPFNFGSNRVRFAPGHRVKGAAHPLYKASSPNRKRHEASGYRIWRKAVLAKDAFTCNVCGQVGGKLHSHHVIPAAHRPDFMLEPWNGKALCKPCHREVHIAAREVLK